MLPRYRSRSGVWEGAALRENRAAGEILNSRKFSSPSLEICPQRTYNAFMTDMRYSQPLTPAVFHILLALAKGDKHGYEIMKAVRQDSDGKVKMGNGTLYGSLKRMLSDELIEDAGDKAENDVTRRKYYRLTRLGRKALHAEMERYVSTVKVIKGYKFAPNSLTGN